VRGCGTEQDEITFAYLGTSEILPVTRQYEYYGSKARKGACSTQGRCETRVQNFRRRL
jgi:hypothetical protein